MPGHTLSLQLAETEQLQSIADLVNRAYRGESGWTRETSLIEGNRVGMDELSALLEDDSAHLLTAVAEERLLACICITLRESEAHIGLFAVDPVYQGMGVGRRVLQLVEKYAWQLPQVQRLVMQVISQRPELLAYYERRGYQRSGEISPFPKHLPVGRPITDELTVETLFKLRR